MQRLTVDSSHTAVDIQDSNNITITDKNGKGSISVTLSQLRFIVDCVTLSDMPVLSRLPSEALPAQ
jgi:hypothetical protein